MAEVGASSVGEKVLEVEHVEPVVKHESHVQCHKSPELIANKEKVGDLTKENNNTARCNLDKMDAESCKVDEKVQKQDASKSNDVSIQPKIEETAKEKSIENVKDSNAVGSHIVGAELKSAQAKDKDSEDRSHSKGASNNVDAGLNKTTGKQQPNSKLYDGKNFVEAPIPKTNAWAKKTGASPATSGGSPTGAKGSTVAASSHKEPVGTSDVSTKSKPDDKTNAMTTPADTILRANANPSELDNKSDVNNVEQLSSSTKPVQSVDSTIKESARGWWGTSAGANVPAPAKKIIQKPEEEKPAASGNSHASLPKTSPKVDSKAKVDAAKTKANPANTSHEKRSPIRNTDVASRRQSGKSESQSGHSPVKSSVQRNRGDSGSSATGVDLTVGSAPERKERVEKLTKPDGLDSASRSSTGAASKSGEGESSKEPQQPKTDEKKKSKWSDTPTPTKDDSLPKGVQSERPSRENEQKPGRKNAGGAHGRNRGSRSQGQDFNDSADWPKLKKGATGLSESEGPTPGSVPSAIDDKAIEGAGSTQVESASVSEGSSSGKSPTDSTVGNHIQPSEESGGDDSSVKDKAKGARKKNIKWKQMPLELPKTERKRSTKPHNPDGGEARDAETRGGDRGGDRRARGGDREYRGGDREYRGDRGDDREARGGDREVRGGDRDTRGGDRDATRGGDRDARGGDRDGRGGSNRDRTFVARIDRGERPPVGAIRRKDTGRVRSDKPADAAEGNDAEAAPRWNPPSRSDAKNWHDAPADPESAGVIGGGYSRGGRGGYRGNRRAPPQGGSRRGGGLGSSFILPGAPMTGFRQHFDANTTHWMNCQYYTIPTTAPPPPTIHYYDAPIVDVCPPSPVVYCDPDAVEKFLKAQIEYYFSEANLEHDFFLRRKMNKDGWIPIQLIAHFKRVMIHGANTKQIVQAMKDSEVVETSTDELLIRCKHNPTRWTVDGIDPVQFSSLKPNAVEFVPRQQFVAGQPFVPGGPQLSDADKPSGLLIATSTSAATATADDKAEVSAEDRVDGASCATAATTTSAEDEQRLSDPSLSINQSINETSSTSRNQDEITRLEDNDKDKSTVIVDTNALSDTEATSFGARNPPTVGQEGSQVDKTSQEGISPDIVGEQTAVTTAVVENSVISTEKLASELSGSGAGGELKRSDSPSLH